MSQTACILLLESEILARQPLAEYLRDCGFKVVEAASVAEARRLLEAETLAIDAVLADASADAEGAFALSRWLRETSPAISVVLAGGAIKAADQAGDLCNEGPALLKPYDHRRVLEHIKCQLASKK